MERTLLGHIISVFCLPEYKQTPVYDRQFVGKYMYVTCFILYLIIR
jgi:hypothetical protein